MKICLIALIALLTSCSTKKPVAKKTTKPKRERPAPKKRKIVLPKEKVTIALGTTKLVQYKIPEPLKVQKISCEKVGEIQFEQRDEQLIFFLPAPYKFEATSYQCHLEVAKQTQAFHFLSVSIEPVKYPTKQLNVAKKHVELSEKNIQRWLKEKAKQDEIYSTPHPMAQFTSPFKRPLRSKITSQFGYKRVFNNKKDSWHSGTDMRAAIGTSIPAANRGIVRFAGELFFNGGTVILDHGLGVYTMYCHLSKVLVQEGEVIPLGGEIAKSGNTGRSTGPHLHWGTRVNGHWVDSLSIVKESELYSHIKK